jgi:hypothetical protein
MILHIRQAWVSVVDPDTDGLKLRQLFGWNNVLDPLQVVCEGAESLFADVLVFCLHQHWIDIDRPALKVNLDGVVKDGLVS